MSNAVLKGKAFRRWVATANTQRAATLEYAVTELVTQLKHEGFHWVDKSFDAGAVPAHTINLEREIDADRVDYVQLVFDKRHLARFQVLFGSKKARAPHGWIRAGALVWKKSDAIQYKWWGARWWNLNPEQALIQAVQTVGEMLPQLCHFLINGAIGNNIWAVTLQDDRGEYNP